MNKVTKKLALQISFVPMLGSTLQVHTRYICTVHTHILAVM
jgi:hypothetical protein